MANSIKYENWFWRLLLMIIIIGLSIPQNLKMPVENATNTSYNVKSFWYYPWGKSITHKGLDIFADMGTNVYSATSGLVIFTGLNDMGGNVVAVLGPKWRIHYYAHLKEIKTKKWAWVSNKTLIGLIGNSGNAQGKPPHLHYAIITPIPYPWRIDGDHQGWQKMFYLNTRHK